MSTPRNYILVADDDALVVRSITFILQRAGFEVETVRNGRDALEKIHADRPALAMLDVMMPEMDGLEVCRRVKSNDELRDVPIFLVTARAMAAERERGLEAGADYYITKPFQNKELIQSIRSVFERTGVPLPTG